jgi:hypothetical protein
MSIDIRTHTVKLGARDYVQVSGRVLIAHEDNPDNLAIITEVTYEDSEKIRVRASVLTRKGEFTGHAESFKQAGSPQEKKSPLEVAETSAIGRALGFAGYAIEGGIASADEVRNSDSRDDGYVSRVTRLDEERREKQAQKSVAPKDMLTKLGASMKATGMSEKELKAEWKKLGFAGRASSSLTPSELDKAIAHYEALKAPPAEPDEASLEF